MKYVYHYCATKAPSHEFGGDTSADGILTWLTPITTMDDYRDVKKEIEDQVFNTRGEWYNITITTLTLLHVLED